LIVAIAGQESNFGRALGQPRATCSARSFNAWSWFLGRSHTCRDSNFTSFADGIQRVTSGIRRLYLDQGAHTIPEILALGNCTSGCGDWVANITNFYTAQDGDTSDLTFHIGLIDFEQFTTASSIFTAAQPPLQVFAEINGQVSTKIADSATISGGQVLNATSNLPVDRSVVYGTASFCSGCQPAITIQFVRKVSHFSVFLLNGEPMIVTYMVEDDQGGMQSKTLVANFKSGSETVMLPEAGIRQVTVTSNGAGVWDFLIDNIRFSPD
jgi:hypothetical protein